jgi:beta-galactosidase
MQYSNNVPWKISGHVMEGFVLDMNPTTAKVMQRFDSGKPLVTQNEYGAGLAVLLGSDAAYAMKSPGNDFLEQWTLKHTLGALQSPYSCDGAIVYRLSAPQADHYFFINDDESKQVKLDFDFYNYNSVSDPLTGDQLRLGEPIDLEGYSGRWLRYAK